MPSTRVSQSAWFTVSGVSPSTPRTPPSLSHAVRTRRGRASPDGTSRGARPSGCVTRCPRGTHRVEPVRLRVFRVWRRVRLPPRDSEATNAILSPDRTSARPSPFLPRSRDNPPSFPFAPTLLTSRPPASRPRPRPRPQVQTRPDLRQGGILRRRVRDPRPIQADARAVHPPLPRHLLPPVRSERSPLDVSSLPGVVGNVTADAVVALGGVRDAQRRREATPAVRPPAAPRAPRTPSYRVSRLTRAPTPPPPPRMVISTPPVPRSAARRVFCSDPARRCGTSGASAQSPKNRSTCRADRPTPRGRGRGGSARARLR